MQLVRAVKLHFVAFCAIIYIVFEGLIIGWREVLLDESGLFEEEKGCTRYDL